jgi:thioredoxin 2
MSASTVDRSPVHVVCPACAQRTRVPAERLGDHPRCPSCKQPLFTGSPVSLVDSSFDTFVANSDLPILIDCWAAWCGPCQAFAPIVARAAAELEPRLIVASLDTESAPEIARRLSIRSIPTLLVFRHGREIGRRTGAMPLAALVAWLGTLGLPVST